MRIKSLLKKIPFVAKLAGKSKKPFDKQVAIENLVYAKELLDQLKVRNWLTDGTLLGYYREKDILEHDIDVDMGSFIADYTDEIIHRFIENGWQVAHIFGKRDMGFELSFIRKKVRLDIFFFYEENGRYWHGAWRNTEKGFNLIKYYYEPFGLKEVEFKGHKFNIPSDPLTYIQTKYGPGWRTPVKEWDWAFGPSNAVATEFYLEG